MTKLLTLPISLAALAGIAFAQPKPSPVAKDKEPAPPAAIKAAPPAEAPKPAQELTDLAKKMAGTWKCTGTGDVKGTSIELKATITHKVDANLNGFWMQTNFSGTAAKMPPMKFTAFTTWDATQKKLYRMSANAYGGWGRAWGTVTDNKVTWEGEARWRDGDVKTRQTEEFVSPKEVKVVGEGSKDGGKTWTKDHEATCKR